MFIRKKKVRGKLYYYIVENKLVDGKVKQTVLMYLGNTENVLEKFKKLKDMD
jgi:hypothetical protein